MKSLLITTALISPMGEVSTLYMLEPVQLQQEGETLTFKITRTDSFLDRDILEESSDFSDVFGDDGINIAATYYVHLDTPSDEDLAMYEKLREILPATEDPTKPWLILRGDPRFSRVHDTRAVKLKKLTKRRWF